MRFAKLLFAAVIFAAASGSSCRVAVQEWPDEPPPRVAPEVPPYYPKYHAAGRLLSVAHDHSQVTFMIAGPTRMIVVWLSDVHLRLDASGLSDQTFVSAWMVSSYYAVTIYAKDDVDYRYWENRLRDWRYGRP